jgi:hypothetical protein
MAKNPQAAAKSTPTGSGLPHPLDKATDEDWAAGWRAAIAPHESFWRKHAKESAKPGLIAEQSANGSALAKTFLEMLGTGAWPTLDDCIPEGSILDVVDKFFYQATDLPRELPFYTVIHYVTALMLQQGVRIKKSKTQDLYPDLWTVVLASSGGGKSMTLDAIAGALGGAVKMFPHANSYPKFFENLQANNRTFYLKDEFAKFIRAINKDTKMEGLQGCLLDVYSNKSLTYSIKAGTETLEKPAISILGLTQIANITDTISKSMMDDGFAQRFGYVFAEKDGRPRVLDYVFDDLAEQVAPLWKQLTATPFHPVYYLDEVVSKTFETGGNIIMDQGDAAGMKEDFSRRVVFRSFKYALAYHVLTGKTDKYLHAEDMAHGLRLCARELRDTTRLLEMFGTLTPPTSATNTAPAMGSTSTTSPIPINKKSPTRGQPLTYAQCVEKCKKKVLDFGAKGKKTTTSNLGAYVKIEVAVLAKILTELAQDPAYGQHITLPNTKE